MTTPSTSREPPTPEEAKAEIIKRVGRYRRAPSMSALINRLGWFCCGDWAVETYCLELVRSGQLRVTDGLFYLPQKWDFMSDLGHR